MTENVLTMSYSLPAKKYDTPDKANAFNEGLLERVRTMPGVRAAGLGFLVPGAGPMGDDAFTIREHPPIPPGQELPVALYGRADPGFFTTLEIPLVSGRFFTNDDRAGHPETVIVSRQLAQQYFPGENPLGKHLHVGAVSDANYEIVGVVADTLYQVGKPSEATIYFPVLRGNSVRYHASGADGVRPVGFLRSAAETDCGAGSGDAGPRCVYFAADHRAVTGQRQP